MAKTETKIFIETSLGLMSLKQIAEKSGVDFRVIRNRYYRGTRGDDLLKPISNKNKPVKLLFDGELRTLTEISSITGLTPDTIYQRYKKRGITGDELFAPQKERHSIEFYVGKKYGRLTILSLSYSPERKKYICKCKCDCGVTKEIDLTRIRNGNTLSCGCYLKEIRGKASITHHQSNTKEHKAWRHIKERCYNSNSKYFHNYGGRGVVMCERWKRSFENFLQDMGPAPSKQHSVDRINVDGNYEPGNCRWATRTQQNRNKRNTIFITYDGKTKSTCEWEDLLGLRRYRLRSVCLKGLDAVSYIDKLRQGEKKHIFVK
ncbi:MAG: hypothetical protein J6U51_07770 [Bacteroidales bacterium]|nr:hypothetical protein [Bacteroidales bacterium]